MKLLLDKCSDLVLSALCRYYSFENTHLPVVGSLSEKNTDIIVNREKSYFFVK